MKKSKNKTKKNIQIYNQNIKKNQKQIFKKKFIKNSIKFQFMY